MIPEVLLALLPILAPGEALAQADRLAHQGQPARAAALYDLAEVAGPWGGAFHYNQGVLHHQAGDGARAVRAFRRALRAGGAPADVGERLAEAQGRGGHQPGGWGGWFREPWWLWPPWSKAALGAGVWGLLSLGLTWRGWPRRKSRRGLAVLALGWALALALALDRQEEGERPLLVVRGEGVLLRQGNGTTYPPWTGPAGPVALAEGTEGRLLARRPNGWVQVELTDGQVGWVPASAALGVP